MDYTLIFTAALFAAIIFAISYLLVMKADTLPLVDGFADMPAQGPAASAPLLQALEGSCTLPEYQEMKMLLAKMAALKADVTSSAATISSTLYHPYITSQDIEQVGETAGRCFAKSIPGRELDIIYEKWSQRGKELVAALGGDAGAEALFISAWNESYDAARAGCLPPPSVAKLVSPREVQPLVAEASASPWSIGL
jgi:hypothetical protein